MPHNNHNFITTGAAARMLDRSENTIRQMSRSGRLPCIRLDHGMRLFRIEDVERIAKERRAGGRR